MQHLMRIGEEGDEKLNRGVETSPKIQKRHYSDKKQVKNRVRELFLYEQIR